MTAFRWHRWVLSLSNAELGARFEAAFADERQETIARRDVLHDEISRRELIGDWTEEDWYA
jgi:hypothetical protein